MLSLIVGEGSRVLALDLQRHGHGAMGSLFNNCVGRFR